MATDVIDAAMTDDGTRGIVATLDGLVTLVNGADGSTLWQKPPPQSFRCTARDRNFCLHVDLADDGSHLLVGTLDNNVYVLDAADGSLLQQQTLENSISSVAISGDGSALLYGDRDGEVRSLNRADSASAFAAEQTSQRNLLLGILIALIVFIVGFHCLGTPDGSGRAFLERPQRAPAPLIPRDVAQPHFLSAHSADDYPAADLQLLSGAVWPLSRLHPVESRL